MTNSAEGKKTCFVIAPIGESGSDIRRHSDLIMEILKHVLDDTDYYPHRGDDDDTTSDITNFVVQQIIEAPLVVADLTYANPNVFYELALRHVVGKPLIQIKAVGTKIPFDVAGIRTLEIDPQSQYAAEKLIKPKVLAAAGQPELDLSVTRAFKTFARRQAALESATDPEKRMIEVIDSLRDRLGTQLQGLEQIRRQLEDSTRKPLHGIDEVFAQIYLMLKNAKVGGRIWFVGMTFGLGPPHLYRKSSVDATMDTAMRGKLGEGFPPFQTIINELHQLLGALIEKAPNPVLVCLTHDKEALKKNFLDKLRKRPSYDTLDVDKVAAEIMSLHKAIADKITGPRQIRYVDSIPLQILVVEKADAAHLAFGKKACVVFHVGTGNIETHVLEDGETGFYTEVDSLADMFETMAESLWEAAGRSSESPADPNRHSDRSNPAELGGPTGSV